MEYEGTFIAMEEGILLDVGRDDERFDFAWGTTRC